jgi:FixJ family two-component response regulator
VSEPVPPSVLCVDDEHHILSTLRRLFLEEGWRVRCASSGSEALAALEREPVGVVISDQRMPEMSGTELLREVKKRHPETIRVILSGFAEISSVVDAINDGEVHRFVGKPWTDDDLVAMLRECFEQHRELVRNRELVRRTEQDIRRLKSLCDQLERQNEAQKVIVDLLHELPLGVLAVDEAGVLVVANERACHLMGAGRIGAPYQEALPRPIVIAVAGAFASERPSRVEAIARRDGALHGVARPRRPSARERGVLVLLSDDARAKEW